MSTESAKESIQSATQQLWRIAETDDSQQAESLLARGAEINASNAFGMTALMRAAAGGRMQMVRVLLEHGANPNKMRNDEFTALMLAAFSGHQEIVRILVEHGANPDAKTRFGTTAQMWAASRTFKEVVRYLEHQGSIQKAGKVATVANNYPQEPQTATSLEVDDNERFEALTDSPRSCVEEADAIPDVDTIPNPPSAVQSCDDLPKAKESTHPATQELWRIAETDNSEQAESLLTLGAEINASNAHGMTALMRAAARGRSRMVRLLLEHGADPNSVRNDQFTALMLAAFSGHQEIVRILIEHGANPDATTRFGTAAQMRAASRDLVNCFESPDFDTAPPTSAIQSCDDSPKERESTQSATQELWRIAETDDSQQAESLLSRGAEINASNAYGMTALMRAAASGRMRMVRVLLEHGADPNRVRNDEFTALMLAAFSGHQEIVRILIEHGANPDATTRLGTAAQMETASRTFKEVVHYLEPPGSIHAAARVAIVTNNYAGPPQTATSSEVADNESHEALADWSKHRVKEADANLRTRAIQNCDDLPDVFEPRKDPFPQPWPLARLQTFSSKVHVYVATALLVCIAVFAHLSLERKQRVAQLAQHARPLAVINESAVTVTARKDSLSNKFEEKAIASPDPQTDRLARNDDQTVNSREPSTLKAPITGTRVVTVADSARRTPSEKPTSSRVTQSLPTLEHTQEVATSPRLTPAPISIAKPPAAVSRESVPEKYSAPQSTQLISGPRGSAPNGRVIQWP